MNARFFYAAPIFTNSPKLSVLTEDEVLYSEHKEYQVVQVERIPNVGFSNFSEKEFENEDYPILLEIGYEEARTMPLGGQSNWIDRYVANKHINTQMEMQA